MAGQLGQLLRDIFLDLLAQRVAGGDVDPGEDGDRALIGLLDRLARGRVDALPLTTVQRVGLAEPREGYPDRGEHLAGQRRLLVPALVEHLQVVDVAENVVQATREVGPGDDDRETRARARHRPHLRRPELGGEVAKVEMPAGMAGALRQQRGELLDRGLELALPEQSLAVHDAEPEDPLPGTREKTEGGEQLLDPLAAEHGAAGNPPQEGVVSDPDLARPVRSVDDVGDAGDDERDLCGRLGQLDRGAIQPEIIDRRRIGVEGGEAGGGAGKFVAQHFIDGGIDRLDRRRLVRQAELGFVQCG
jgi:hypothetical protein